MEQGRFKLDTCVAKEDATDAAELAAKIAEVLAGNDTQTVLNALVFIQAEFIARQPEASRSVMMKLLSDAVEANVNFFDEAVAAHKASLVNAVDAMAEALIEALGKPA
jgi:hypothetical protein